MITETTKLQEKISNLEADLSLKFEEQKEIEKRLAADYAASEDPSTNLRSLAENRDATQGMVSALKALDVSLFDCQANEHERLAEKLDAEARAAFDTAIAAAGKALKPLKKSLEIVIDKAEIPGLFDTIIDRIGVVLWSSIDNSAQARYSNEVPCMPREPLPRNEFGIRHERPLQWLGRQ